MKYFFLVLATFVSGYISGNNETANSITYIIKGNIGENIALYAPGIIFGIMLGLWLFFTQETKLIKIVAWVVASVFAYFSALWGGVTLVSNGGMAALFVAGLIGVTILTISTYFLIEKLNFKQMLTLMAIGGFAGLAFSLNDTYHTFIPLEVSFIIWQMAVGIALGIMVSMNKKKLDINFG